MFSNGKTTNANLYQSNPYFNEIPVKSQNNVFWNLQNKSIIHTKESDHPRE